MRAHRRCRRVRIASHQRVYNSAGLGHRFRGRARAETQPEQPQMHRLPGQCVAQQRVAARLRDGGMEPCVRFREHLVGQAHVRAFRLVHAFRQCHKSPAFGVDINLAALAASAAVGMIAFLGVVLHNGLGPAFGYLASRRLFGMTQEDPQAITFEVGLGNTGIAIAPAIGHLDRVAVIPAAIFGARHNVSGSALARYWASRIERQAPRTAASREAT